MTTAVDRDRSVGSFQSWGYQPVDFDAFHQVELPRRLSAEIGKQVSRDTRGAAPITVRLDDGRAYSYVAGPSGVGVVPGAVADAETDLEFDEQSWQNYVYEFRSPPSLVLAQSVRFRKGGLDSWEAWVPAMRCMYSGKQIYDPSMEFLDLDGSPLDLHRTFSLDDDWAQMSHFLRTSGFVVVKGALSHRLGEISDEVERLRAEATEGELFSWWTHDETGHRFPYRLVFMAEKSSLIKSLGDDDPVVRRLVALAQRDLVPLHDRGQGDLTVLKPFGPQSEVSGFANLPWHMDCELGGCPIMCPSINIGIQLDAANAASSQLVVLAGSHGTAPHRYSTFDDVPAIALETEPGDVTIHYSCSLHAGPRPTGPLPRRTVYLPFYAPATLELLGRFQSFEQVIPGYGSGNMPTLDEVEQELR